MKRRPDDDTSRYPPSRDARRCRHVGLGIAIGLSAGILGYAILNNNEPAKQNTAPQAELSQSVEQTDKNLPAIDFNLYRSPKNEWAGVKITIDRTIIDEWARYAPVKITIPELSYTASFPVEQGAKSAETTFPSPVPASGTYHYIIFGKDPATGNAKELYRHVLAPSK
jgi:hypothetical protein